MRRMTSVSLGSVCTALLSEAGFVTSPQLRAGAVYDKLV